MAAGQDLITEVSKCLLRGEGQSEIAAKFGITQPFVSKLGKAALLPVTVLQHWRGEKQQRVAGFAIDPKWHKLSVIDICAVGAFAARYTMTDKLAELHYVEMIAANECARLRGNYLRERSAQSLDEYRRATAMLHAVTSKIAHLTAATL